MEYFINALKHYADFSGRARRKEYWMYALFYFIFYIAFIAIDAVLGTMAIFTAIFALALLVPSFAITARRLHDIGKSGWWQLLYFIPLVGAIVMFIFLVQDSHDENDYGLNPKAA